MNSELRSIDVRNTIRLDIHSLVRVSANLFHGLYPRTFIPEAATYEHTDTKRVISNSEVKTSERLNLLAND